MMETMNSFPLCILQNQKRTQVMTSSIEFKVKIKAIRRRKKRDLLVQTAVPVKKALQFAIEHSAFCQQLQLLVLTKLDMGGFIGHRIRELNS
jgi:hypothetical protein